MRLLSSAQRTHANSSVDTPVNVDAATIDNLHRFKRLRGCKVGKSLRWKPSDVTRFVTELQPDD